MYSLVRNSSISSSLVSPAAISRSSRRRARAATGTFDYDQRGPLDHGHVRFFTRKSFERLIAQCGLRIVERETVGSPFDILERGASSDRAARIAGRVAVADRAATRMWPTMFGYQFLYRLERA